MKKRNKIQNSPYLICFVTKQFQNSRDNWKTFAILTVSIIFQLYYYIIVTTVVNSYTQSILYGCINSNLRLIKKKIRKTQ